MATQNEQGLYQYYMSTDDNPAKVILTATEISNVSYPLTDKAPSPELKSPKFDWRTNQWVENDTEATSQKLVQLEAKVKDLDQTATKLENTAQVLSSTQQASAEQNGLLMKQMQSNQQMMMQMQTMLASISKNVEGK